MIGASNKGRGACWVHTETGTCREPPRPELHTCLKHRERFGYAPDEGLDPWTKREREIEDMLAVGHGALDEFEEHDFFADVHGLTPDVNEARALFLVAIKNGQLYARLESGARIERDGLGSC